MHHYVDAVKKFYAGSVEVAKDLKQFSVRWRDICASMGTP